MRAPFAIAAVLLLAAAACCQTVSSPAYSSDRVARMAKAISHAEGYGFRGTIPRRYRNPGDLKCYAKPPDCGFDGVARIGKAGHIVFRSDRDGWAALRRQIELIVTGRSRRYTLDSTFDQMARTYAASWRNWSRTVTAELGVTGRTRLRSYLCAGELDAAPKLVFGGGAQ